MGSLTANILPDQSLQSLFDETNSLTNTIRYIKVTLNPKNTNLVLSETAPNSGEPDETEFTKSLETLLSPESPQYILFQKDDKQWILISYVPESSSRTEKMLYASCMGSLKSSFGAGRISHQFTINEKREMKWSYFKKQYFEINKEELLSDREKAIAANHILEEESRREAIQAQAELVKRININPLGGSTGGGVAFPFSDEAKQAIQDFQAEEINYRMVCQINIKI